MKAQEFTDLIEQAAKDSGIELRAAAREVGVYAASRAAYLAGLVGQAGYDLAWRAETDNVALFAGIRAVREADSKQARFIGVLQGALWMAASGGAA